MSISRRDLIKSLSASALAGQVLRVVPAEAAEHAHSLVSAEKSASPLGDYTPKFFPAHQYKTLQALCHAIIPPDHESGGALEAGAPEFLDLLSSENKDLQRQLGGGIMWLDSTCARRYDAIYVECTPAQQVEILDLISFRKNGEKDSGLGPGIEFFSLLRKYTSDGFFTSKIGIKYLGYIGNTYLKEFPGCPPVPEA